MTGTIEKIIQNFEKALGFLGIAVLGWMIVRLGPSRIAANLYLVNWGFFFIVLTKSLKYFCQTAAWKLILAQEHKNIGFWKLFKINLEGESLNYITMTKMGGEPYKALAIKENVPLTASAASVIVLKFCTLLGFWFVISAGFLALLFDADVTGDIKTNIGIGLVAVTLFLLSLSWIQKSGLFKPVAWLLNQFQSKREWFSEQVLRLTKLDNKILETYRLKSGRITFSVLLSIMGWMEEFFFIWIAFHFLKIKESWFLPTLIGTISLILNSLFFFVPWKAGTQEGTMVLTFTILKLSEPLGLSIAILKRMRELVWIFSGLILFALETLPSQTEPSPTV